MASSRVAAYRPTVSSFLQRQSTLEQQCCSASPIPLFSNSAKNPSFFRQPNFTPFLHFNTKRLLISAAKSDKHAAAASAKAEAKSARKAEASVDASKEKVGEEEEYEEMSWVEDKVETVKEFTASVIARTPGPRVGQTGLPWIIALPTFYFSVTFLIAVIRLVRKWNTPKAKRRRLVGKNATVVESLDKFFPSNWQSFDVKELRKLERQCEFGSDEVLRKYVRYALNEKQFTPQLVASLIHLRKVCGLADSEVVEIVNDISRRTVKAKGPVMMDTRGLTEKGLKRKAAVQAIFTKLLYLAELDEFISAEARKKLEIAAIFGVTDEDVEAIRIQTLSETSDIDSLEAMIGSDEEEGEKSEKDL